MKLSKSSIFSPCRITASRNGSIKRGCRQSSSSFLSSTKKKCNGFENPEPTSPKVTCIGQVRGKTKKKLKQRRSLSSRRLQKSEEISLPVSICDAFRTFGSEFSCLFIPCKSSCFSTNEKSKWLVSVNDGENGEEREIEFFYEDDVEKRSSRRHVFEDIEVKDGRIEVKGKSVMDVQPRLSISIPPKNALLLMRCRSDPIKMATLANKFSLSGHENREEDQTFTCIIKHDEMGSVFEQDFVVSDEPDEEQEITLEVEKANLERIQEDGLVICSQKMEIEVKDEQALMTSKEGEGEGEEDKEETESNMSSFEDLLDQEPNADLIHCPIKENVESLVCNVLPPAKDSEGTHQECAIQDLVNKNEEETEKLAKKESSSALPDCLMLMMCSEPKLSMEVSKETWVCTTDFVRRQKPPKSKANKKIQMEPPRASCSLIKAMTYEPFVLSRCKSAPMRTAAAKLVPAESSCLWNNNNNNNKAIGI